MTSMSAALASKRLPPCSKRTTPPFQTFSEQQGHRKSTGRTQAQQPAHIVLNAPTIFSPVDFAFSENLSTAVFACSVPLETSLTSAPIFTQSSNRFIRIRLLSSLIAHMIQFPRKGNCRICSCSRLYFVRARGGALVAPRFRIIKAHVPCFLKASFHLAKVIPCNFKIRRSFSHAITAFCVQAFRPSQP